jgi:hypothetical protein
MPVITSAAAATQSATVTVTSWWLKDPTTPARNMPLKVERVSGGLPFSKPEDLGEFSPLGRTRDIFIADQVRGEQIDLPLIFTTAADWTSFETLRGSQRVLLLQSDMTAQWYVRIGKDRKAQLQFSGERTTTKPVRRVVPHFVEADTP